MLAIYITQTIKNYQKILSSFFEMLGFIALIYEILSIFIPEQINNIHFSFGDLILVCIFFMIVSIIKNIPRLKRKYNIKNRDINITIIIGDIFKQSGAKVIPTNTTFDTSMENDFISEKSIQGQFQVNNFRNNLSRLDEMLECSLHNTDIKEKLTDNRKTKKNRYECGTVSEINYMNNRYYFLGLADVNKNGTPKAQYENILIALQGLWTYLEEHKHIDKLVLPILGTGRAGIAEATRMKVIKDTISSFVAFSSEVKITDNLILCIHPKDLINNKIDIDEVFEYVDYSSKYKYDQIDNHKDGKPIE